MSDLELHIIVASLDLLLIVIEIENLLLQPATIEDFLFSFGFSLLQSCLKFSDLTLSFFILLGVLVLVVDSGEMMSVLQVTDLQFILFDFLIQGDVEVHFLLGELTSMILPQVRDLSFQFRNSTFVGIFFVAQFGL